MTIIKVDETYHNITKLPIYVKWNYNLLNVCQETLQWHDLKQDEIIDCTTDHIWGSVQVY